VRVGVCVCVLVSVCVTALFAACPLPACSALHLQGSCPTPSATEEPGGAASFPRPHEFCLRRSPSSPEDEKKDTRADATNDAWVNAELRTTAQERANLLKQKQDEESDRKENKIGREWKEGCKIVINRQRDENSGGEREPPEYVISVE
jgi:hypothetical protein